MTPGLKAWLEKLENELLHRDRDYRRAVSDKQTHVFGISADDLLYETSRQLSSRKISIPSNEVKNQQKVLENLAEFYYKKIKEEVILNNPTTHETRMEGTSEVFLATFEASKEDKRASIYNKVAKSYTNSLTEYYSKVQGLFKNYESLQTTKVKDFFDLGHREQSEVFEASIAAHLRTKDLKTKKGKPSVLAARRLQKLLDQAETTLTLSAVMNNSTGVVHVTLEAASFNRARGQKSSVISKKLRKTIRDVLERGKFTLTKVKNSDSILEAKRKQAIKGVTDPFRKIKGAKVSTETTKIIPSKGKVSVKKTGKTRTVYRDLTTGKFISKTAYQQAKTKAPSPISLMALINAQLYPTVAKNMGLPGLVYRSGTFALSAEVDQINRTPEGLDIAFKYQTEPYGVFQMGRGIPPWATPERDPRKVIGESVREIAVKLVQEKFTVRSLI